jgi:hypothetical protein
MYILHLDETYLPLLRISKSVVGTLHVSINNSIDRLYDLTITDHISINEHMLRNMEEQEHFWWLFRQIPMIQHISRTHQCHYMSIHWCEFLPSVHWQQTFFWLDTREHINRDNNVINQSSRYMLATKPIVGINIQLITFLVWMWYWFV